MAKNFVEDGRFQTRVVASDVVAGDPVVFGTAGMHGVAMGDYGSAGATKAVVDFGPGIFSLPVKGHDGTDPAAISQYAKVYFDSVLGGLNVKTSGVFFGYALEAVGSNETKTIEVFMDR
jgi:predicted RecA/RadA family phage recombinase